MNMIKPPRLLIDQSEEFAKIIIDRHPECIEKYKVNKAIVSFLMKEAMRECRGSVNPVMMREAIIEEIEARILDKD